MFLKINFTPDLKLMFKVYDNSIAKEGNLRDIIVMVPNLRKVMNTSVIINTGRTFISVAVSSSEPNILAVRLMIDTVVL